MGSPDCIALVQEATKNLGLRHFHEAIELATRAIRLEPRHAPAYVVRAVAFRRLNKHDRALADLSLAIRLEPDRPTPYVIRAEIFKRRCEPDRAIDDATQAIFLDPNHAAAFEVRAACRKAIGDDEGAAEDAGEVLRIDPTRPPAAEENPTSPSGPEPSRKGTAGTVPDAYRDLFADGKPADETYRSLSTEEAAKALGRDGRYKPETITPSLTRIRARRGGSGRPAWSLAMLITSGVVIVACFFLVNRRSIPEAPVAVHLVERPEAEPPRSGEAPRPPKEAVTVPTEVAADWINLLPYIDPATGSFGGRWGAVEGGLISPEGGSLIHISYRTPAEYRLRVRLMKGSEQMVGIGLVTGQTQHLITIDSYPTQGCFCKFDVVDGESIAFHQGGRVLPMHEVSTVICTVRKRSIVVECSGREVGRWEGDFRRLSVHPAWSYGPKTGLFVASVGKGTVLKGVNLLPLSEEGATVRTADRPVLASLASLNTGQGDLIPWVSGDGSTIYWTVIAGNPPRLTSSIWTATRRAADAPFEGPRKLFDGFNPTLSGDGRIIVFSRGGHLWIADRGSPGDDFRSPVRIETLRDQPHPRNPCLSSDGLTLYFMRLKSEEEGFEPCFTGRAGLDAAWSEPVPIPFAGEKPAEPSGPFVSPDGLTLMATESGREKSDGVGLVIWSRDRMTSPFGARRPVSFGGLDMPGGSGHFRYVRATRELFFSANTPGGSTDLYSIRDFTIPEFGGDIRSPGHVEDAPRKREGLKASPARANEARDRPSEMLALAELNTTAWDGEPWVSPDGLTIYWMSQGPNIWTANRKTPDSLFENKRLLCKGMCPTVTADGLQMFLIDRRADGDKGNSIYPTRRASTGEPFERPREVAELRSVRRPFGLSLSFDGLTLYFTDYSSQEKAPRLYQSGRRSSGSKWGEPAPLWITRPEGLDHGPDDPEYPFVTHDRLKMYCELQGRIMVLTRSAPGLPFTRSESLNLSVSPKSGCFAPRYVESTNELFFCSKPPEGSGSRPDDVDLYVVKDFRLPGK